LQVGISLVPQLGADAVADLCEDVGLRPADEPRQDRRPGKARQVPRDEPQIDRHLWILLVGDQHIVDQGLRQVRRNHANRRAGQRQDKAQQNSREPRTGELGQPPKNEPRRLGDRRLAGRALDDIGIEHRPATWADGGFDFILRGIRPFAQSSEPPYQAMYGGGLRCGVPPTGQAVRFAHQFQGADA
jgi:hypothetical protein